MLSGKWNFLPHIINLLLAVALTGAEASIVHRHEENARDELSSSTVTFGSSSTCTLWRSRDCRPVFPKGYDINVSTLFFWYPVSWGPCSKHCGGGVQRMVIYCVDHSFKKVELSSCAHLDFAQFEQACNIFPCSSYRSHKLPWSECNRTCGIGYQTREIICRNHLGNIVDLGHCEVKNYSLLKPCNMQPCNSSYWEVSRWSRCDAPCGGGKRRRVVKCNINGTTKAPCLNKPPDTEQVCNSHPCQTHAWLVGPWHDCPNGCQAYTKRIVQCVDGSGNEEPDIMCMGVKPAKSLQCCRSNASCSGCLYSDCLGNGVCQEGACACFERWEGAHCERRKQCKGFLGYSGNTTVICCSLLDVNQRCCLSSAAVLDRDGNCCESGKLDVCGVCNGFAIMVDVESKCCTTVRDEKGLCCQSGILDECHVCDGDGTSCATNITLKLNFTSNTGNIQFFNALPSLSYSSASHIASKLNITNEAISVTGIDVTNLDGNICHDEIAGSNYCTQGRGFTGIVEVNITVAPMEVPFEADLLHVDHISRSGVCGNGLCERGERCNFEGNSASLIGRTCCLKDCPYVSFSCPAGTIGMEENHLCSGNGICLDSTGHCSCFEGYAGRDCSKCALNWIPIRNGSCMKLPDSKTLARLAMAAAGGTLHSSVAEDFEPHTSHVKLNANKGSKLSVGAKVGILIGSMGIMLMAIILAFSILFRKKTSVVSTPTMRHIEIPETPRGPGENATPSSKLPSWRTSFLGPDFDIIPITPMAKQVPLDRLLYIADAENDSNTKQSALSQKLKIFGASSHIQQISGQKSSTLATNEDLTEEEQCKIAKMVKKSLKRGESARFITDFLTDSESDSDTHEPDSDCQPQLPFVLDAASPTTGKQQLYMQFRP